MERRKPLRIQVPNGESPRFGRVGVIALVGFVVGISWPHLAGIRLVPRAPTPAGERTSEDVSAAPAPAGEVTKAADAEPEGPGPTPFTVSPGEVTSCRDATGKRVQSCDAVDFDGVARGRLATLSACPAAARAQGVLSVGFELDFGRDRVTGVQTGKSTSVPEADARALIACLNETLGEVSLSGISHDHARYTVFYRVEFRDAAAALGDEAPPASAVTPASGRATVSWDVALVREGPSRDASVVARVLSGTRVTVTGRQDDWYRIKYDGKGREGWVFRTAIGM